MGRNSRTVGGYQGQAVKVIELIDQKIRETGGYILDNRSDQSGPSPTQTPGLKGLCGLHSVMVRGVKKYRSPDELYIGYNY